MRSKGQIFFITILTWLFLDGCMKDEFSSKRRKLVLPSDVAEYDLPANPTFFVPYGDSVINNHIATLGRVLFFEVQLSRNNRVSCGTCHKQQHGFADNLAFSHGFANVFAGRNTSSLVNTGTQFGFFWDLRESTLDHMVLQPIANHIEMGIPDTLYMEEKIRRTEYYKPLFLAAFGSEEVTTKKMGRALAQFVKSIISVSSKYDHGILLVDPNLTMGTGANMVDFPNYSDIENLGKRLFFRKFPCSQCHGGVNLDGSLSAPKNIGLELDYIDNGKIGTDNFGMPLDGFFKTPTLRNISLTGPYMHDGHIKTLQEVVEFYNSGILPHPQLSEELRIREQGGLTPEHLGPVVNMEFIPVDGTTIPQRMFMTGEEKAALVAFLNTLTDELVLTDSKFSDPFVSE